MVVSTSVIAASRRLLRVLAAQDNGQMDVINLAGVAKRSLHPGFCLPPARKQEDNNSNFGLQKAEIGRVNAFQRCSDWPDEGNLCTSRSAGLLEPDPLRNRANNQRF